MQLAIYFDDHYSGWTVHRNVMANVELGSFIHFGRHNNFSNNIYYQVGIGFTIETGGQSDKTTLLPPIQQAMSSDVWSTLWLVKYPELKSLMTQPADQKCCFCAPYHNVVVGNVIADYTGRSSKWILDSWMKGVAGEALIVGRNWNGTVAAAKFKAADPIAELDFTLTPGSPARQMLPGWEDVPTDVGPRRFQQRCLTTLCPPEPPAPSPTGTNECQPSKHCNVCAACCKDWITDDKVCDNCVKDSCHFAPW